MKRSFEDNTDSDTGAKRAALAGARQWNKSKELAPGCFMLTTILEDAKEREVLDRMAKRAMEVVDRDTELFIFGKKCKQPRATAFTGPAAAYKYSGGKVKSKGTTDEDIAMITLANELLVSAYGFMGAPFTKTNRYNSILINLYKRADSIGSHGDDEKELNNLPVMGASMGMPRALDFRAFDQKSMAKEHILLSHNTQPYEIYIMFGDDFQKKLKHGIAKLGQGKSAILPDQVSDYENTRISFTMRSFEINTN